MTPKRMKYPLVRLLATGAFASLALLAACEAKLPTAAEMDNMTASSATAAAGRVALIDTAKVVYFVNGVEVTKADAEKLEADAIASVNVLQKGMRSGGEVRIVTRASGTRAETLSTRLTYVRTEPSAAVTFVTPGDSVTLTADVTAKGAGENRARVVTDTISRPRTFNGLVVINGVLRESSAMNTLSPDQIAEVNVIKGVAATTKYSDPRAANGVIEIVTKAAKP